MNRVPAGANLPSFMVAAGGLVVAVWAHFLALVSVTLLASFAVILLSLALLLVIGGLIALSRDVSRR